jgi:16S rRNA (cytosine1402-N4)-methyltransferase
MDEQEPQKPRRIRYKGTHPKAFKEKYKELQPDQYAEDVEKVKLQGRTPAGMHRSICVTEIMEFLQIAPGQTGLDATLGYGGHSLEILKCLAPGGHLYANDVDPFELPRTQKRLADLGYGDDVLTIKKMNFSGTTNPNFSSGDYDVVKQMKRIIPEYISNNSVYQAIDKDKGDQELLVLRHTS